MNKTKTKMIRLSEEELHEIKERAQEMHISANQLLVLGALNWDGRIIVKKDEQKTINKNPHIPEEEK